MFDSSVRYIVFMVDDVAFERDNHCDADVMRLIIMYGTRLPLDGGKW